MNILSDFIYVVNYDADNGLTNIISKFKNVSKISKDVDNFYNKISKTQIAMSDTSSMKAFSQGMGFVDDSFTSFLENTDYSEKSLENYQKYLQSTTKSTSSFGKSLKSLGANLLSIGANMAIWLGITVVIKAAYTVLDNYIHRVENAKQANQEFSDSFNTLKSSLDSDRDTIDKISTRYNELSKNVNNLGTNVGLTKEEFEEYHSITRQISEMYPSLVTGYDAQGYAIINLKDAVSELNAEYEKAKENAYWEQIQKAPDVLDNFTTIVKDQEKELEKYQKILDSSKQGYDSFRDFLWGSGSDYYLNGLMDLGIDLSFEEKDMNLIRDQIRQRIQSINTEIESETQKVTPLLESYLYVNDTYKTFDSDLKSALSSIINNISPELLQQFDNGLDMSDWINSIVEQVSSNPDISDALTGLFSLNTDEISPDEAKDIVDRYISKIAEILGENPIELKIKLGFEDVDGLATKYTNAIKSTQNKFGTDESEFFAKNSINTQEEIDKWLECAEAANTAADAKQRYLSIENESPILSTSDIIEKMDSELKPAFESIKSAYEDIFTFNDKGKEVFTLENVDLSMLSSIKSSLDSVSEDLKINIDYSSFEDLSKILVDSSSTADDVRDAFDALSSTVLSSLSSSISECTDENAELVQSMLESIGITNAQELVSEALEGRYLDEAAAKSILANASLDLETVTISEISALEQEGTIAPLVATRLYELAFAKQMSNSENMDTSGEVANLLALAENCGYTGEAVTYLTELEQIYQQVASGTLSPEMLDAKLSRASELQELIKSASANISYKPNVEFNPNFNNKKAKDAASKAGKDAADAYKESLEKEVQKYETALSGITGLLSKQISAYGKQKEAAVDSLNAQKEAAEEAYEAQKKAIDEQIKGIETQINALEKQKKSRQDEIDKIRDANNERDLQLDLEKKIHEYNQMLNQRSRVYTEKKGVIYTQNTSGVLDAKNAVDDARDEIKISGIEKDIKSIENSIDSLNDKIDGFEDQKNKIDELIESSNNYYESLIKQTESYWDSLIDGLTNYKSRWEELGDIQENAKLIASLKEFGMTTEDILSMSDSAFASFKDGYLNSLNNLYAGNDSMLSAISEAAGSTTDDLGTYSEATKSYLDTLAKTDLSGVATDLSTTADGMDRVASSSQTASTNTQSTAESMTALNESTTGISDNLTAISEGLDKIASTTGFETMNESLAELLNMIAELSETSLNEGIITQFANLKTAIESVTASIGGGSTGGSSGGEDGEGVSGLTGAMQEHGNISAEILGGSGEDNEGLGEIGQFGQLKEAVDNVSASIGSGEESEKSGSEEGGSLTSSLQSHFEVASEVVPQEQELFQNLTDVMGQAKEYIESIKTTLEDMDGKEFSVTLNISGGGINGMTFTTDESSEKKGDNVEVFASGGVVTASNPYFDAFANKHGEDTMVAVRKGERILTPVQNDYWERWTKAIPNLLEGYNTLVDVKKPDYSNIATTKLQAQNIKIDIGDIKLEGVQNSDALAKKIVNKLPNNIIQEMYRKQ